MLTKCSLFTLAVLICAKAVPAWESCAGHDSDCFGLTALAKSAGVSGWKKNTGWLHGSSVCDWYGVKCKHGRVIEIDLKSNGLKGSIPEEIGNVTELEVLRLEGSRPTNYIGCAGNDLNGSALPDGLFSLKQLSDLDLEYTCMGGTLRPEVGRLTSLTSLQLHGNYIGGTIPTELGRLTALQILKLGRNPFTGTLPAFRTLPNLVQFNCNFCSLTGTFPDVFDSMPELEVTYWDGNGFSGPLPPSIGRAKKVSRLSFNINNFSGPIPPSICHIPAGSGGDTPGVDHDCRIGHDTDLAAYSAKYPWIQAVTGNVFDCPVPICAVVGSCNKTQGTKVVNPVSPVVCK